MEREREKEKSRESMSSKEQVNMTKVFSIILGGGAGTRLQPLTLRRAKPAVSDGNVTWNFLATQDNLQVLYDRTITIMACRT